MPNQHQTVGPHRNMDGVMLIGKAVDHDAGDTSAGHQHEVIQLLYAISGVMRIDTAKGQWIVPPSRGIWIPQHVWHEVHMVGQVELRTLYIQPDAAIGLPTECCVLAITPLMRELILSVMSFGDSFLPESREGRIARLILDEIVTLQALPMVLPMPQNNPLSGLCDALLRKPDDSRSSEEWAAKLGVDVRTLQRRFVRATGMTFGEWRRQARLVKALERLAAGERIIDVALDSGYSSPSAFTAMFKRQFGIAPNAFFH
jgi:AraC-like DNA-binding protein/mannose-6-phosphate isomerase-like protein (cupin superfamily)